MFSRDRIAKAAAELADHLQIIDTVRSLQVGQKELADAIKTLGQQVREIQTELRALKAETRLEALRETQTIVNAVQGGLNQRIEALAVKIAVVESGVYEARWNGHGPALLPAPTGRLASSNHDNGSIL
jgi:cell fate (sporulation/competence/biofilm development) regulator YmcA (YheA/YmcA/DUF963 family)